MDKVNKNIILYGIIILGLVCLASPVLAEADGYETVLTRNDLYNWTNIAFEGPTLDFTTYDDTIIAGFVIWDIDTETDNKTLTIYYRDGTVLEGFIDNAVTVPLISSYTEFFLDGNFCNATNAIPFSILPTNGNGNVLVSIAADPTGFRNLTMEKSYSTRYIPHNNDLLYNGIYRIYVDSQGDKSFRVSVAYMDEEQRAIGVYQQETMFNPDANIYQRFSKITGWVGEVISLLIALLDLLFIKGVFVLTIVLIELGFTAYAANNSKDIFIFFKRWIGFNVKFFQTLIDIMQKVTEILINIINTINPLKWLIP
jgi:hypothetical protein